MGVTMESVVQRFEGAHAISQEGVETISLWVLHYKDKQSIDIIVSGWLQVFKSASSENHKIALFYIMNDAVQKAKGKHLDYFIVAFQPAVLSAITSGRTSPKVKKTMERCIAIFKEREIFSTATITAMQNILHGAETGEVDDGCLELNNTEVCSKIEKFEMGCRVTDEIKSLMADTVFEDFSTIKLRIGDKNSAFEELEKSKVLLETLINLRHGMETQKKGMLELGETLEIAKRLYSHALKEVTVVEDAYKKFYQGIKDTQKELLEMRQTGIYPAATPPRDCASPTEGEDIFETIALNNISQAQNTTVTDMEIDDDEDHQPATASVIPPLMNFNRLPPSWPPNGPPPPINFSLPPPQLISPGAISIRPPAVPNYSVPPPNNNAPRDPRQGSFINEQQPALNPQVFTSHPYGSSESNHSVQINQQFPPYNNDTSQGSYSNRRDSFERGNQPNNQRNERRDSWDREPRDPRRDDYRGGRRGNRDQRQSDGYRQSRWNDRRN